MLGTSLLIQNCVQDAMLHKMKVNSLEFTDIIQETIILSFPDVCKRVLMVIKVRTLITEHDPKNQVQYVNTTLSLVCLTMDVCRLK